MKATCTNCNSELTLNEKQILLIEKLKEQRNTFGMLKCDQCKKTFSINPQDLGSSYINHEFGWHTPIAGVNGFVSYIEETNEKSFYGCGESGVVWFSKKSFYHDIESIISKYPHRALFYEKRNNDWFPSIEGPKNMTELIESEEKEDIQTFER